MSFFTDDDIVKLDEDEATREAQENIPTQVAQELKQEQQDLAVF
jgi:hypothetical protein